MNSLLRRSRISAAAVPGGAVLAGILLFTLCPTAGPAALLTTVDADTHDVGVTDIVAPVGTLDSGAVITPACSVDNFGNFTESYPVRLRIGVTYDQTVHVDSHPAGRRRYLTFPACTVVTRGSNAVSCSTELATDSSPNNDRKTGTFTVRVRNVGCTRLIVPAGTIDSGTSVTPACSVYNHGTVSESYSVRMKVGTNYDRVVTVDTHAAGRRRYVTFPAYTVGPRGVYSTSCSTRLAADRIPADDRRTGSFTSRVRNVECSHLLAPLGAIDSGTVVTPVCSVYNHGSAAETYRVRMRIGFWYNRTTQVTGHTPGTRVQVTFPSLTMVWRGMRSVVCSTELTGDVRPSNDRRVDSCFVASHDIGLRELIEPAEAVDSGTAIVPRVVVHNYGNVNEGFLLNLRINDGYAESLALALAPDADSEFTFPAWTARGRGMRTVRCSARLARDGIPQNNGLRESLLVVVHDIAARTILVPVGQVDSGANITPRAEVHSNSSVTESLAVEFRIGSAYADTQGVRLAPGATDTVFFRRWIAHPVGLAATRCSTMLPVDMISTNNRAPGQVEVIPVPQHDVGCAAIIAPAGMVDSGRTVTPACTVHNWGESNESYRVRMRIGTGYNATVQVTGHASGTSQVVTFPDFLAVTPGVWPVTCSTELTPDANRSNDRQSGPVVVARHDVAATAIVAPAGTVDSGHVATPRATVRNYGNVTETFDIVFTVDDGYRATINRAVAAGVDSTFAFPDWPVGRRGTHVTACTTRLVSDMRPANDGIAGTVQVAVHDLGAVAILVPRDTVVYGTFLTPQAVVTNLGTATENGLVRFSIGDSYVSNLPVTLAPGQTDTIDFQTWIAYPLGRHIVVCSTRLATDTRPDNDRTLDSVVVVSLTGITGDTTMPAVFALAPGRPTPFARSVALHYTVPRAARVELAVFAADGRLVRRLKSGPHPPGRYHITWNGLDTHGRPPPPGIYYCRMTSPGFITVRKLVKSER